MTQAIKNGQTVQIHYTGRLENGEVFDSSEGRQPLEFKVGSSQVISGFENAVVGMQPGENKTVTIPPDDAYGPVRDELVVEVPNEELPDDMELEAGMKLQMTDPEGNDIPAVISEILETGIRIDVNHPLAGKTLIFDLQIVTPE